MNIVALILQLVSGAVGGNIAGALLKKIDQGPLLNSILGIVGGGIGGQILQAVLGAAAGESGLDFGSIIKSIAGGGVGGGILMAIVGLIRGSMKNAPR